MTKEEFFARYTFDRNTDRLGAGSFGTVFRAYDTVLDLWVALKLSAVSGSSIRLSREVELVSGLPEHPNVASYLGCYTFDDSSGAFDVAILRYYPEGSLADLLSRREFPAEQTDAVLAQILEGLRFLHSHSIVHRDLKPGNILIARRPDGRIVPKITDFGISKQVAGADDTVTTAVTVAYASPEQLRGQPAGPNADLWSFGVIAYRLLAGRMPFTAADLDPNSMAGRAEITRRITSGQLPADLGALPGPWSSIVNACFVLDPRLRVSDESALLAKIADAAPAQPEVVDMPDAELLRGPVADSDTTARRDDETELMKTRVAPQPEPQLIGRPDSTGDIMLRMVIVLAIVAAIFMVYFLTLDRDGKKYDSIPAPPTVEGYNTTSDRNRIDELTVEPAADAEDTLAADVDQNFAEEHKAEAAKPDSAAARVADEPELNESERNFFD